MTPADVETYLHEHIPISAAMGIKVLETTFHHAQLSAPLAPNINHRETVFGGSASALAILSAWTLLFVRMRELQIEARLVIQRNTVTYELPMLDTFTATTMPLNESEWIRFIGILKRKGRARVTVKSTLRCQGERVGEFEGEFVALLQKT